MSSHPYWSLNFVIRVDVDPTVLRVLRCVASRDAPRQEDLGALHPSAREYLEHPDRLVADVVDSGWGAPIRLSTDWQGNILLSIEFCQHDDQYANGGWGFWLWVLSLAQPPTVGRDVIVVHGLYRHDSASCLVFIDSEGIWEGDTPPVSFDEIAQGLVLADQTDVG